MTTDQNETPIPLPKPEERPINTSKKPACIVFTLLVLAMSGYGLYVALNLRYTLAEQQQILSTTLERLQEKQTSAQSILNEQKDQWAQTEARVTEHLNALNQRVNAALKQHDYQQQDWQLLNVRYYLELAQINAHWRGNGATTIALLQQADSIIANLHDTRALKIRQAIATELTTAKTQPMPDLTGLLSELGALQQAIRDLPLRKPTSLPKKTATTIQPATSPTNWRAHLNSLLQRFNQWVVIRHHDAQIEPQLTPIMENLIREKIQLLLQETQWAALQQDEALYRLCLTQTLAELKRSFDPKAIKTWIATLQQLQDKLILQPSIHLDESLSLVNAWIEADETHTSTEENPS